MHILEKSNEQSLYLMSREEVGIPERKKQLSMDVAVLPSSLFDTA